MGRGRQVGLSCTSTKSRGFHVMSALDRSDFHPIKESRDSIDLIYQSYLWISSKSNDVMRLYIFTMFLSDAQSMLEIRYHT